MLSFLSNRATAAHLAIAAVAPLVLCKYCGGGTICFLAAWLTLLVIVWSIMSPVRREDEHLMDARLRYVTDLVFDPFFYVAVLMVVYAAVVSLNSGVALRYDLELKTWSLARPAAELLPGAIPGGGVALLTGALLTLCVYSGVAHSLDSQQAVYFAIFTATLATIETAFALAADFGIRGESAAAYGFWALAAAAAMFSADQTRQRPKELISAVALTGCVTALLFSGRPKVACIFLAAIVLLALVFIAFKILELRFSGAIRALLMLFVSFAIAAAIFHWLSGEWEALIPVWKSETDPILNQYALEAWKANHWTGTGVGSFPIVAKLAATAEDWNLLGPLPDFTGCAWRTLLVERGVVGLLVIAASTVTMLYTWVRFTAQRGLEHFTAAVPLLPITLAAASAVMFFDGSALQPEAIVAFFALSAFSVNGGQ